MSNVKPVTVQEVSVILRKAGLAPKDARVVASTGRVHVTAYGMHFAKAFTALDAAGIVTEPNGNMSNHIMCTGIKNG